MGLFSAFVGDLENMAKCALTSQSELTYGIDICFGPLLRMTVSGPLLRMTVSGSDFKFDFLAQSN